jgi:Uma2 family endonuclease
MEPAYKLRSLEKFLDACPNDRRHYQLFDGVMVAKAPPGGRHQIIALAIGALLYTAVEARMPGCTVRSQAGIAPQGVRGRDHFETDITVTCEPLDDRRRGIVANPLLIVEVLSPSADRDDVIVKLPAYQSIASLREILYVETDRIAATVYRRTGDAWQAIALSSPEARLQLETIGFDVALCSLYRGIPGLAG